MKVRKFKTDEWVLYCQFPESNFESLRSDRKRAVVLEVLPESDIYDYRIFIDDGTSTYRKVREKHLFPVENNTTNL